MAATLDSLNEEIERVERSIYDADRRAVGSARALRARWQAAAPKVMFGVAAALAAAIVGGFLLRSRNAAAARRAIAGRAAPGSLQQLLRTARPLMRHMGPRLLTAGSALLAGIAAKRAQPPLTTAASVDLERLAGTWHEIARLPERHEKDCATDITTTYALTDEGLRILNRCTREDGSVRRAFAHAQIVPGTGNAKFKVSYAPKLLDVLPFVWSDLYVVHIADDYTSAVLGTPDRKHLWLLARDAKVTDEVRGSFVTKAQAQGFDTSRLVYT